YLAHAPDRVVLAPGESSATVTIMTDPVTAPTKVRIIAATGTTIEASLLLLPRPAASITLDPSSVTGGGTVTGTVTLASPAPPGGTLVDLASDNAAATVPQQVKIVAGASAALFTIATQPVASAATAHISAAWG